ncbi:MAG: ribF [Dehalococcoidia bacterium]|nr:ribF [Dehalococcoidia bacterium]
MSVEDELKGYTPDTKSWFSIGVFDGVHLGHRHLIKNLLEQSQKSGAISGVITFKQHPRQVISAGTPITYLTNLDERVRLLKELGVDVVIALTFTPELAQFSARDFIGLLQKRLRLHGLVVGPDFALGKGREGDVVTLQRLAGDMGFQLLVVPHLTQGNEAVSSTAVRKALSTGAMESVTRMLGRPYTLTGPVVSGKGQGRVLGFPTANIQVNHNATIPADGVYVTRAHISNKSYPSVTNIGQCPTFGGCERTVEVFLLDYSGDLYNQTLTIDVLERIRAEKRFDSPQELQKQINQDVEKARKIFIG